eukprot:m51a1_g5053 hypothetical protein (930) ;mRNA; f:70180-74210
MGGSQSVPRPETAASLYHLRAITGLLATHIKRLRVCFYELVPSGRIPLADWPSLFEPRLASCGLPGALWRVLKSEQAQAIARVEGPLEASVLGGGVPGDTPPLPPDEDPDIAGDPALFDWFDFVYAFHCALLLPHHRLWSFFFKLMSPKGDWIRAEDVRRAGETAGADGAALAAEISALFGDDAALSEAQLVQRADKAAAPFPLLLGYFGALEALRGHLKRAEALMLEGALEGGEGTYAEAVGQLWRLSEGGSWAERLVTVRNGFMWYHSSDGSQLRQVSPLYRVSVNFEENDERQNCFSVLSGAWFRQFSAKTRQEMHRWIHTILKNSREPDDNGLSSYSPPRIMPTSTDSVTFYVDGEDYFGAVEDAIRGAEEEVMVCGWFLCPSLYLRRGPGATVYDRLDYVLAQQARRGVRVYVLLWNEPKIAFELRSEWAVSRLSEAGANIVVLRHPPTFPLYWSHHQKLVVVDQRAAYLGGLDLAFGRWDTPQHALADPCALSTRWPGKDYYNSSFSEMAGLDRPDDTALDRANVPRMPWHDVCVRVTGDVARDTAWNFIQRWHHHLRDNEATVASSPLPRQAPPPSSPHGARAQAQGCAYTCQAVRSICEWSGGTCCETSCNEAYTELIRRSRRFVYIENQFFSSLLDPDGMHNTVSEALYERLRAAISARETYRVVVLVPLHPEGMSLTTIRFIMKWQYETICQGEGSVMGRLSAEFPEVDLGEYMAFVSLRQWGLLPPALGAGDFAERVATEMVYVHSKLMIVDDEVAMVGSANINDRSLLGDRDSELSVVVSGGERVECSMAGERVSVSRVVHELRVRLWAEHTAADPRALQDPACDETFKGVLLGTAEANTRAYEQVFGASIPSDSIRSLAQYRPPVACQLPDREAAALLREHVRGHIVRFPLRFLEDEDLSPSSLEREGLLDAFLFQ